jgi:hypothetical protein
LSTSISPKRGGAFVTLGTILLTGLAGGALCCLLALVIKREPSWLLLPLALAVGAFLRWQGYRGTRGAIMAASAMLIALVYTEYLYAAVRMADTLGFPLRDTLFKMDFGLAWQMIRANFSGWDAIALASAPIIAALIGASGSLPEKTDSP